MSRFAAFFFFLFSFFFLLNAATPRVMNISDTESPEVIIALDAQAHADYGFSIPLTYALKISGVTGAGPVRVVKRYSMTGSWEMIPEAPADSNYNNIECFRIDPASRSLVVSAAFHAGSDSLIIGCLDGSGQPVSVNFSTIYPYYDNRRTAVICSADDMAGWSRSKFERAIDIFRSFNLWLTCGINTNGCNAEMYQYIQSELDAGLVEASAHSRSHPAARPYSDYEGEIAGCKSDLINNLDMPGSFRSGEQEYVYTWIAPNGYLDAVIDSIVGREKYLVNRLYTRDYFGFPEWNDDVNYFSPVGVARAIDPPREILGWGIGSDDIEYLNSGFDQSLEEGSLYHVMCHPNVVQWDSAYTMDHLEYISNRTDVWYTAVGHAFLYHLAQTGYSVNVTSVVQQAESVPETVTLAMNFPNPFNATTMIRFTLAGSMPVRLQVYNALGQKLETLVDQPMQSGTHDIPWHAENVSSGIYYFQLQAGKTYHRGRMLLIK